MKNRTPTSFDQDGPEGRGLGERLTLLEAATLSEDDRALQDFSLEELWMLNRVAGIEVDDDLEETVSITRDVGIAFVRSALASKATGAALDVPDEEVDDDLERALLVVFPEMGDEDDWGDEEDES